MAIRSEGPRPGCRRSGTGSGGRWWEGLTGVDLPFLPTPTGRLPHRSRPAGPPPPDSTGLYPDPAPVPAVVYYQLLTGSFRRDCRGCVRGAVALVPTVPSTRRSISPFSSPSGRRGNAGDSRRSEVTCAAAGGRVTLGPGPGWSLGNAGAVELGTTWTAPVAFGETLFRPPLPSEKTLPLSS